MAFLFKFFACCQSSKNIEAEKENQEFRLSSPRFGDPVPQNVFGNHNFANAPQAQSNNNSQNDQTFQGNISFRLDSPVNKEEETNFYYPNQVSFENIKDQPDNNDNNEPGENQDKDSLLKEESNKQPQQEFQIVSLSRFDPEKKSRFATENKEFKKTMTLTKDEKSENNESKTTVGGFLVMNKIKRSEDEKKSKDPLAHAKSREILNSTPILRPQKNP